MNISDSLFSIFREQNSTIPSASNCGLEIVQEMIGQGSLYFLVTHQISSALRIKFARPQEAH